MSTETYSTAQIAKAIAQYLGQEASYIEPIWCERTVSMLTEGNLSYVSANKPRLILRPIASLTDKECIKIFDNGNDDFEPIADEDKISCIRTCLADDWAGIDLTHGARLTDYLRSIGIDMPNYHLGGKTLQEAGLAIYKEVKP